MREGPGDEAIGSTLHSKKCTGRERVCATWCSAAFWEIQSMVEDHLKSLVLRHFDPKKADLIFTAKV